MFIEVDSHPLLDPAAIRVELSTPQGNESPDWLQKLLEPGNGWRSHTALIAGNRLPAVLFVPPAGWSMPRTDYTI